MHGLLDPLTRLHFPAFEPAIEMSFASWYFVIVTLLAHERLTTSLSSTAGRVQYSAGLSKRSDSPG